MTFPSFPNSAKAPVEAADEILLAKVRLNVKNVN
jgi:hypothetical protein